MDLGAQLVATSPLGQAARALVPLIDEHGEYADREGRLHDDVVDAFHRDGLYQMWVPEVLGGSELDPLHSLETLEIASYADPSAGWVLMASCLAIGTAGSYLADDAVAELWADGRRPVIAGQGTRPGTAVPHEDGFLVSGSWSFASGLLHGTHIHTLAVITTTGEPRIFVVPVEKASLLGNWDVLGLRGTGSIDYELDNVYVPDSYSHFAVIDEPRRGGALYRVGIIGFAGMCHSGWALGVGRRLLDELGALVHDGAGRAGARAASDAFQQDYAKAEATLRAARALVFEAWGDAWDTLGAGGRMSVREHTLVRLALTNATKALAEVSDFVYLAGGTTALRRGTIQRLVRDVHAGTQHVTSAPAVWANCGLELVGLADGKHWQFLDLVDP
jgi:alkylation response protein AidB-like acyl-CoA dehydrogenase